MKNVCCEVGFHMTRRVDKSPRPDGMHPRDLKEVAGEFVESLTMIFQESIDCSIDWKIANATPLFKKVGRQKQNKL